jgi:hypothetical protein
MGLFLCPFEHVDARGVEVVGSQVLRESFARSRGR